MTQYNFTVDYGLTLNNANITATTANNPGAINWVGNSSGDGNGYTTIQMVPDETVFGNDQYLIIDPTGGSPGHIHIRAGGTQDNSSADLFLGGENSYVKLPAGQDPNVQLAANTHVWTFGSAGAYGELTLPAGEGAIRTIDDTLALVSFNTTTGNANSVYLGSSGGLGFNDQEIGGNWLEIFRSGTEPEIRVPVGRGNLNIQTAEGGNVYNWTFDNTGNLVLPSNTFAVNYANGTAVTLGGTYGNAQVANFLGNLGSNAVSTTGNVTANNFIGNIQLTGNIQGTSANVELVAGSYTWTFDNTGVATFPGNVSVTGNVITPNLPAFRVYGNGVTNVSITTNTTGVLNGNNWAVDYNQGSYLNSTTGTFTAPVTGLYQVNLNARVANNTGSASQVIVYKNYGTANTVQVMWETAANCTVNHFGVSTVSKLAAGDTLNLVVTVGQLTFDANDSWSVAFLG